MRVGHGRGPVTGVAEMSLLILLASHLYPDAVLHSFLLLCGDSICFLSLVPVNILNLQCFESVDRPRCASRPRSHPPSTVTRVLPQQPALAQGAVLAASARWCDGCFRAESWTPLAVWNLDIDS